MADINPTVEDTPDAEDRPAFRQVYKAAIVISSGQALSQSVRIPNPTKVVTIEVPAVMETAVLTVETKVNSDSAAFGAHQKDAGGGALTLSHTTGTQSNFPIIDCHSCEELRLNSSVNPASDRTLQLRFQ